MSVTWHQSYEGGRIVARLGQIEIGAVFPGDRPSWRMWICGSTIMREGKAKTELAAKSALLAALYDWLRLAGLEMAERT